jgi:hypothetical protein
MTESEKRAALEAFLKNYKMPMVACDKTLKHIETRQDAVRYDWYLWLAAWEASRAAMPAAHECNDNCYRTASEGIPCPFMPTGDGWMPFNINDYVKVRLTGRGRQIHREKFVELMRGINRNYEYQAPKEDDLGFSKWQAWDLMHTFGEHAYIGFDVPFETRILIAVPQPPAVEDKP